MRRITNLLMTTAFMAAACLGQGPEPASDPTYYRLDFTVKEVEGGKVVNSRAYSTTITSASGVRSSIRTGNKVAYQSGPNPNFQYVDVGVNIDSYELRERGSQLALSVNAEISSIAPSEATSNFPPLIRQNKWIANVILSVGKPTVIFSSDDLTSKRQMQLELTATPIK